VNISVGLTNAGSGTSAGSIVFVLFSTPRIEACLKTETLASSDPTHSDCRFLSHIDHQLGVDRVFVFGDIDEPTDQVLRK
jgi:hypothetical protein